MAENMSPSGPRHTSLKQPPPEKLCLRFVSDSEELAAVLLLLRVDVWGLDHFCTWFTVEEVPGRRCRGVSLLIPWAYLAESWPNFSAVASI